MVKGYEINRIYYKYCGHNKTHKSYTSMIVAITILNTNHTAIIVAITILYIHHTSIIASIAILNTSIPP